MTSRVCGFCAPVRRSAYSNGEEHGSSGPAVEDAQEGRLWVGRAELDRAARGGAAGSRRGVRDRHVGRHVGAADELELGRRASGVPPVPTAKTWNRCSPYGDVGVGAPESHGSNSVESSAHMNVAPVPPKSKLKDVGRRLEVRSGDGRRDREERRLGLRLDCELVRRLRGGRQVVVARDVTGTDLERVLARRRGPRTRSRGRTSRPLRARRTPPTRPGRPRSCW